MWLPQRLPYDPSEIKRARITLVGQKATSQSQRHANAPIRVDVSRVLHELDYRIKASPSLDAGQLPNTTTRTGSIEFSGTLAGRFCVDWSQTFAGNLRCSISTDLQPGDQGVIQAQTAPTVNLEFESRDACATTPLTTLCESKCVFLRGVEFAHLKAWISISRETFIGRSRFVLKIHARLVEEEGTQTRKPRTRQRRMKNLLPNRVPSPIGLDDKLHRLPYRQQNQTPAGNDEQQ